MIQKKISVRSHSGYKADEYPYSFVFEDREYTVNEITDRWYQGENDPDFPASDYFRVETPGGSFLLKHEIKSDVWYLCK